MVKSPVVGQCVHKEAATPKAAVTGNGSRVSSPVASGSAHKLEFDNEINDRIFAGNNHDSGGNIRNENILGGLRPRACAQEQSHTQVAGLGNQQHMESGGDYEPQYEKVCYMQDLIESEQFDSGEKLWQDCDLENHIIFNTFESDLENHNGGEIQGSSLPPSHDSCGMYDINNQKMRQFGFIPLENDNVVEGPDCNAHPSVLWGRRRLSDDANMHNFNSFKIPVKSGFNLEKFQQLASGYWDEKVFELIKYGFPLDVGPSFIPSACNKNHSSAEQYPNDVGLYIGKEVSEGALQLVDSSSFNFYHTSPLMSRPKEGKSRRIILDLSWPHTSNGSVNACVPVDSYLSKPFILKLPTIDDICQTINSFNTSVCIYKIDLARAFRQIPLDPLDAAYLGICWQGSTYIDTAVPFGWRHGSSACQRITDTIRYILNKQGITIINYIDDFIGITPVHDMQRAFEITQQTLEQIGLITSWEKTNYPSRVCTCLGIIINTINSTISISDDKLKNVICMCKRYLKYKKITKHQLQTLLGNLLYIHKAITPARLFVNRIIALLKKSPEKGKIAINAEFQRDLHWFIAFAHMYNGHTRYDNIQENIDFTIYVDASSTGLGACLNTQVYTLPIQGEKDNIAYWEAINVLLALRTWAHILGNKKVRIMCDNQAAVSIFNTSRGSDMTLQAIARNIWLLAATHDIRLQFEHVPGEQNCVADLLSRWRGTYNPTAKLYKLLNNQPEWIDVDRNYLALNWNI
jgi:hypothetical protein